MASVTSRGISLAARNLSTRANTSLVPHVASPVMKAPPPTSTTPAQQKALRKVLRLRRRAIGTSIGDLSRFGPMPLPAGTATSETRIWNPFLPKKNIKTKRWWESKYSRRRQADLAKLALSTGTLDALPPGPKTTALAERIARVRNSLQGADVKHLNKALKTVPLTPLHVPEPPLVVKARTDPVGVLAKAKASRKIVREGKERVSDLTTFVRRLSLNHKHKQKQRLARNIVDGELLKQPIAWAGKLPEQKKGAELGIRLYAGRKRMFKGHLWERKRAARVKLQASLMRTMAARVARYKNYYKKRKPNPLKPSRYTKPPKLPF